VKKKSNRLCTTTPYEAASAKSLHAINVHKSYAIQSMKQKIAKQKNTGTGNGEWGTLKLRQAFKMPHFLKPFVVLPSAASKPYSLRRTLDTSASTIAAPATIAAATGHLQDLLAADGIITKLPKSLAF
jgi:hypothetical protein